MILICSCRIQLEPQNSRLNYSEFEPDTSLFWCIACRNVGYFVAEITHSIMAEIHYEAVRTKLNSSQTILKRWRLSLNFRKAADDNYTS